MRRIVAFAAAFAALAVAGAAAAQSLPVNVGQAERVVVGSAIRDVAIGNPVIADVTVLDSHSVLVTGKAYGVTNLLIVDQRGRTVLNREVVVSGSDASSVTLWRGGAASTYACAPRCERSGGAEPDQNPNGSGTE